MDLSRGEEGGDFLRYLRDAEAYSFDLAGKDGVRKQGYEALRRKYSVEMRQKATIREKNRIRSIGREFCKLANLLPESNGMKRSHQKILHDTVAYIRALEVELDLIDEEALLQQWAAANEGEEEERNLKNEKVSGENGSSYSWKNFDRDSNTKRKTAIIQSSQYQSAVMPAEYDFLYFREHHEKCTNEINGYEKVIGKREESQTYCYNNLGTKEDVLTTKFKGEELTGAVVKVEDDYEALSDDDSDMKENSLVIYPGKLAQQPFENDEGKKHSLSFDKVITGLHFTL